MSQKRSHPKYENYINEDKGSRVRAEEQLLG